MATNPIDNLDTLWIRELEARRERLPKRSPLRQWIRLEIQHVRRGMMIGKEPVHVCYDPISGHSDCDGCQEQAQRESYNAYQREKNDKVMAIDKEK